MNSNLKNRFFISITAGILLSFSVGFYVGNGTLSFGSAQVDAQVDMAPFWKVWNIINEKYVSASTTQTVSQQDKIYGAISGLVESVGDPYTVFLTPEEKTQFDESIEGVFEGVGMEVGLQDGQLTVVAPLKDSPAQKAGIEKGDAILLIDKADTTGMKIEEAVSLIRGPKGSVVTLTLLKKDAEKPVEIKVTRDQITVATLDTKIIGDVFVVSLYSFGASAEEEFEAAMASFVKSKKHKLILDMRGNPGGYLDAAVDISSYFLPAGKTIVTEDFGQNITPKVFRSKGYDTINPKFNMIVLIDEGSASASEIVAGALRENHVAQLVGTKSFGKGSVQELIDITPETSLKVTIARWLTPDGNSISLKGITPDVEIKFDAELFKKTQKDNQLLKAIELLK